MPSAFDYTCPVQFLQAYLEERKTRDKAFSLRFWAKSMGLRSHTLLAFLLSRKRAIRLSHLSFLSKGLEIPPKELFYLQVLIQRAGAKSLEEQAFFDRVMRETNPRGPRPSREIDECLVMSRWEYTYVLALVDLGPPSLDARAAYESLTDELQAQTDPERIQEAMERLKRLGMVAFEGGRWRASASFTCRNDFADEAVRGYHSRISALASQAVHSQDMRHREFQSCSLAFDTSRMAEAKALIREFRARFEKLMEEPSGDSVYQLNLQLFHLTRPGLSKEAAMTA